jgi:hypothetical protein
MTACCKRSGQVTGIAGGCHLYGPMLSIDLSKFVHLILSFIDIQTYNRNEYQEYFLEVKAAGA